MAILKAIGSNDLDQQIVATKTDTLFIGSYLVAGSTSGAVTLTTPSVVTDYTITIPAAQGGAGTVQTNDGSGNMTWTVPSGVANSFANPTLTLNSAAQISTTRDADVSYSVDISCSMSLTGGQSGTAILEYADDSSFTTNVKTVSRGTNANSGTLTIGLALVQVGTANLAGIIPAGKYRRVRTVNNTGTPTFTAQNAQEVLI